jgi:hypothetical protein
MKKFFLVVGILITGLGYSQTFSAFELLSHGCVSMNPPPKDTLTYYFNNDTLYITVIKYGHCCYRPHTSIMLNQDTISFSIPDTSTVFCTCDCQYGFHYRLYGFPGNLYYASAFGKNYIIDRALSGLQEHIQKPVFGREGNTIRVLISNSDLKVNILDLKGELKYTTSRKEIDLNRLNLVPGVYLFQCVTPDQRVSQKFFIE